MPTDLTMHLQELSEKHGPGLPWHPWLSEAERWNELVFCLLNQCADLEPAVIRTAVELLQALELVDLQHLAQIDSIDTESAAVIRHVLVRLGFTLEDANRAILLLSHTGKVTRDLYAGKIQQCLRKFGETLRDELVSTFRCDALDNGQLRFASTHWLQNAISLPLTLERESLVKFGGVHGATVADVLQAADELNINTLLVDDLLEAEYTSHENLAGVR